MDRKQKSSEKLGNDKLICLFIVLNKANNSMIKDFQETINTICAQFNNKITQLDIIAWLENFDKEDWKKALIVLNNFEFFSTEAIIRELDNGLKLICIY